MKFFKKIIKPTKFLLILGAGVLLARYGLFKDSIGSTTVRQIEPQKVIVSKSVSALGEVKSSKDAMLSFTTSGTISHIAVEKGQELQAGQLIASLINPEAEHTIQAARDTRDIALRDKDSFLEKYKKKSARDLLGGENQYQIQLRMLDEAISRTEANYQAALATYSRNYLYAPFAGRVLDVYKTKGEVAAATEPIIKLAKDDLIFEVSVDQSDFGLLKEGQEVELFLDAYANQKFSGKISTLPKYANGGINPSFTVEIAFDDPTNQVLLGMRGDVKIIVDSTEGEVTALLYDEVLFDAEEKPYIWIVEDGYIEKFPVEIGLEGDLYTEIKTDISDKVLVAPFNNNIQLEQGFKAKIQK